MVGKWFDSWCIHKLVITSILVVARFLTSTEGHLDSGKRTHTSLAQHSVELLMVLLWFKVYDLSNTVVQWLVLWMQCVTLSGGSPRGCVGFKQQPCIKEDTHTVFPSTWCAACVVLLNSVPNL